MRTFSDVIGLSVDHRHYGAVQTYRCVHDLVTTTTICGLNSKWDPEPLCVSMKLERMYCWQAYAHLVIAFYRP